MKFWKIETWNLEFQIFKKILQLEILKTEGLDLKIGHWECRIENLDFERYLKTLKKIFFFFFGLTESTQFDWVDSALVELSVGAEILAPHFFVSFLFLFCFIFHQLFLLHWHYSLSHSPWFFFFISPFLLTKSTFLSLLTFPHPSIFL